LAYGIQHLIVTAKQIVVRARFTGSTRRVALAATALACLACSKQADLGTIGDGPSSVLWRGTFEPGDFSEWTGDGEGGIYTQPVATTPPAVTTALVHGGRYAGVVTLTPMNNMPSTTYLFRNQPSPQAAYYSAWFFVPSSIPVATWLSLTHFSGSTTGDGKNLTAVWDVNLYPMIGGGGGLAAELYDYLDGMNTRETSPTPVPRDSWVQFEVFVSKATTKTGQVEVWQNGTLILQRTNVSTGMNDWLQWDAGGSSPDPMASPGSVYMDDAAISLVRLGPGS
jgi:hypothetical protein